MERTHGHTDKPEERAHPVCRRAPGSHRGDPHGCGDSGALGPSTLWAASGTGALWWREGRRRALLPQQGLQAMAVAGGLKCRVHCVFGQGLPLGEPQPLGPEKAKLEEPNIPESHVPSSTQRTTGSCCFRSEDAPEKRNKQRFGQCPASHSRRGHWLQERGQEARPRPAHTLST